MICAYLLIFLSLIGSSNTEIRISNQSKVPIQEVRVQFPSQTESYGTIPAKGVTDYRVVKKAYRYARIEAVVDGKRAILQPIDYVGEKELKAGKYTYILTINKNASSEYDRLRLQCRKE
jgi:hypothetical protein